MRALIRGERVASIGVVLGLLGLLALLVGSLGLTLAYRAQLADLKSTIYERCVQRTTYDQSNHDAVVANRRLYSALVAIAHQAPQPTDPEVRRLYARQVAALEEAERSAADAAAGGVIGSCDQYRH